MAPEAANAPWKRTVGPPTLTLLISLPKPPLPSTYRNFRQPERVIHTGISISSGDLSHKRYTRVPVIETESFKQFLYIACTIPSAILLNQSSAESSFAGGGAIKFELLAILLSFEVSLLPFTQSWQRHCRTA